MTQDQNKKSLHQFQCREYLWEIFEQMGAELECSTDYLINEAMRQYARSRNWGSRANRSSAPMSAPGTPGGSSAGVRPQTSPGMSTTGPLGQTSAYGGRAPGLPGGSAPGRTPRTTQNTGPASMPPPLPGTSSGGSARLPSLFVIFNGQKFPVNKEEFVIGRGSKTADLPIKDGNISRRHAAVVFQNGAFYMKDLGSTNGIEFAGERVDTRKIEDGDLYQLCDYELRFTYH